MWWSGWSRRVRRRFFNEHAVGLDLHLDLDSIDDAEAERVGAILRMRSPHLRSGMRRVSAVARRIDQSSKCSR